MKERPGQDNINTILLDSRTLINGDKEFIMTDDKQKWISDFSELYTNRGFLLDTSGLTGGRNYTWSSSDEETDIVMAFYDNGKLMVQPGVSGESVMD